ncbi:hypothetical protein [Streptomyces sp. NBC_00280]|uniref:hypothetical protein n=1 Tax=Streptomyces sp. NBC_00280 TaxID=2975699 RepID=UPI0032452DE6
MSSDNPPPGGPPHAPPYTPPQAPQAPQPSQPPRWAWWVVGIVIPVVGLLVTVLVGRPGSSDGRTVESAPTPTRSSASAENAGQGQPAPAPTKRAEPDKALFGPEVVDADTTNSGSYIELDTAEPIVSDSSLKGADIIFGASLGDPNLFVPGSGSMLAPLPASGATPTADECAQAVEDNGGYTSNVKRGDRFCLMTDKGRVAYLVVVTAPSTGIGKLNVTVWDTPAV